MNSPPRDGAPAAPSPNERRLILLGGIVALLPFVWRLASFRELFWFGDEWDLLDQIARFGFWRWMWSVFAENFVPLFKLLWGGAALLGGGSYLVMLGLLWLTHAWNTVLLGRVLRTAGFPLFAVLFSQLVFGLTAANIETLGWTVQWSAVLAMTFLLSGLAQPGGPGGRQDAWLAACAAGSALSFSRGVLTGAVLALGALWPSARLRLALDRAALRRAALCLAPAVAVAALIAVFATGNHRQLGGHLGQAAQYAAWYLALNPLHRLLAVDSWGPLTTSGLGALKLALVAWGLIRSTPRQRHLLVLLLAFDAGNAVLLGIGRYHTGLETAISSRYQYGALLATLPFAGLWLHALLSRIPLGGWRQPALQGAVLTGVAGAMLLPWPQEAAGFAHERGTVTRNLLHHDPNPPALGAVPGIPFLATDRAKELQRRYGLK